MWRAAKVKLLRLDYLCPLRLECCEALEPIERFHDLLTAALPPLTLAQKILAVMITVRPASTSVQWVNAAQTEAEIEALRRYVNRGTPYGTETWQTQIAAMLGLKSTLQPRGRPRKQLELTSTRT